MKAYFCGTVLFVIIWLKWWNVPRRRFPIRWSRQLGLEQHFYIPKQFLPPYCLYLTPPRSLIQPCAFQSSGWSLVGWPCAFPGQPSFCSSLLRELDLQSEPPEHERLLQCPRRLSSSRSFPHPHQTPSLHASHLLTPQPNTGSQIQCIVAAWCKEPKSVHLQHQ